MTTLSLHYDLSKAVDKAKFDVAQNALGHKAVLDRTTEYLKAHMGGPISPESVLKVMRDAAQQSGFVSFMEVIDRR